MWTLHGRTQEAAATLSASRLAGGVSESWLRARGHTLAGGGRAVAEMHADVTTAVSTATQQALCWLQKFLVHCCPDMLPSLGKK